MASIKFDQNKGTETAHQASQKCAQMHKLNTVFFTVKTRRKV